MDDLISRQAAIAYAISGRVRTLPTTEDGENWIRTAEVRQSLLTMPSAHPEIICCKDCKHRPYKDEDGEVWPTSWDDLICPCLRENSYYSWMPEDDFFCKRGERREDDNDREQ